MDSRSSETCRQTGPPAGRGGVDGQEAGPDRVGVALEMLPQIPEVALQPPEAKKMAQQPDPAPERGIPWSPAAAAPEAQALGDHARLSKEMYAQASEELGPTWATYKHIHTSTAGRACTRRVRER